MIRINKKDYLDLRARFGGLFEEIQKTAKAHEDGTVTFDETSLAAAFESMVISWLKNTPVYFKQTFEADDELSKLQRQQREQAEANAQAIIQAAQARMQHYLIEEGLLEDARNLQLMTDWFDTNRAAYTVHNIDLCVAALAPQLTWAVWSPRLRKAKTEEVPPTSEPDYVDTLTRAQVVAKLRSDRETRERFIERCGGLARINQRLAAPEPEVQQVQ